MEEVIACAGKGIDVSEIPSEIKLLPLGQVRSQKGDFVVDDESFDLIWHQFKARNIDIVIDYEHQTLHDVQAPAGGWIKELLKGQDAILAKVEWTSRAAEYLKNREYRYLSPVVMVRKRDHKACEIHSAALTNTPAIDGMFPIVNSLGIEESSSNKTNGGKNMDVKKLLVLLGLPETASEDQIEEAVEALVKASSKPKDPENKPGESGKDGEGTAVVANSTILSMLGLSADAKTEDVAAMIMKLQSGTDMQKELIALKERMQERDAEDAVEAALKAGKITAAQKEWAKEYALKDGEGFKNFVEKAPVVVPVGKLELKDAPEHGDEDVDPYILKELGITKEDYEKYGKRGEDE